MSAKLGFLKPPTRKIILRYPRESRSNLEPNYKLTLWLTPHMHTHKKLSDWLPSHRSRVRGISCQETLWLEGKRIYLRKEQG